MADDPRIDIRIDRVLELTRFVSEQQAQIRALYAYLNEQPAPDPARLAQLLQHEQARLKGLRDSAGGPEAALAALFRDFSGRPQ